VPGRSQASSRWHELAEGQEHGKQLKLAYCSQLLCGVPYEVARSAGTFKHHGLDVQLVYMRGGNRGDSGAGRGCGRLRCHLAGRCHPSLCQCRSGHSAALGVTGRLPLFAVVTSPRTASQIRSFRDLREETVGITALGTADHALMLYLLKQAGADAGKVQFATMGVNLLEALRQDQIDAGLVQEPALTLLRRSCARVLMNAMDLKDAGQYLGVPMNFMGVAYALGNRAAQRRWLR